jgi:hypothetical protein
VDGWKESGRELDRLLRDWWEGGGGGGGVMLLKNHVFLVPFETGFDQSSSI